MKCPECDTVFDGTLSYDGKSVLPDEYDKTVMLTEPCPVCKQADIYIEAMLGDLYTPIRKRKK